jgi:DNA-binding NarL/FixJ family response regulator
MRGRRPGARLPAETIRVVVVEPRSLFGVAVREVLDQEDGIEVVAQVRSSDEALEIVETAAPDVILVSGSLAEATDAEAARRLHDGTPSSAMVVLGGEDDDSSLVGAVQIGATGHVAELAEPEELVDTIRRVADGEDQLRAELSLRPDLVGRIVDEVRQALALETSPENPLTSREIQVLGLAACGLRNREIGIELDVSAHTVKNHVTAILHKLGAPNRTRAVLYAARQGWLVLPDVQDVDGGTRSPLTLVSSRGADDAGSSA